MSTFNTWLDTFLDEKDFGYHQWEIATRTDTHLFNSDIIIAHLKHSSRTQQVRIKNVLIKIDFKNGSILNFFKGYAHKLLHAYGVHTL